MSEQLGQGRCTRCGNGVGNHGMLSHVYIETTQPQPPTPAAEDEREGLLEACAPVEHSIASDGHMWRVRDPQEIANRILAAGYRKRPEVTVEDVALIQRVRARYTAEPVPPCRVCGAELSIQSMGGGHATVYGHATPEGVSLREWGDHYDASRWTQLRAGDSDVLALLALINGDRS